MATLKALVIGYGYMGQIRRQVVERVAELDLCGICDPNWVPAEGEARVAHFADYRAAIETAKPDLAFVCTPNRHSPQICAYALRRGIHVFCEKPPGRNVSDVQCIIDAERAGAGTKLMFGFNHRHHPAILEAKSIAEAGRMGRILWMRGVYGKSGGHGHEFEQSWRNDPEVSGGGILLDQGIHMLDLFRFFCGDFDQIQGTLTTAYWNVRVEDNAFVILRNAHGQVAQLHSSATLWKHTFKLDIGLEGGYLLVEGLLSKTGSYGREKLVIGRKPSEGDAAALGNPREEVAYFDQDRSWDIQVRQFVDCIQRDVPVTDSSSFDALRVMEIIDAVYTDASSRRTSRPSAVGEIAR